MGPRRRGARRRLRTGRSASRRSTTWPAPSRSRPTAGCFSSACKNGTGKFFSTENWKAAGPGIRGHGQRILNAHFTPNGTNARDLERRRHRAALGRGEPPDDRRAAGRAAQRSGVRRQYPEPRRLLPVRAAHRHGGHATGARAAASGATWPADIAGREFTRREWEEVLLDRPYRKVCSPS